MDTTIVNLIETYGSYKKSESAEALAQLMRINKDQVTKTIDVLLQSHQTEKKLWQLASSILAKTNPKSAVEKLAGYVDHEEMEIRYHVIGLLGDLGNMDATPYIIDQVKRESDPNVRHLAIHSLLKIGDKRALPILEWLAENDQGEDFEGRKVSEEARMAINSLNSK